MMDRELFTELWLAGASVPGMAARLGCRQPLIYKLRLKYGLPNRPRVRCTEPDPTPEEIAERATALRERWSEAERERRLAGTPLSWSVPSIRLA